MNQHVFVQRQRPDTAAVETPHKALRRIAALAGCHHAILHRLAPSDAALKPLSLIHNWRDGALLSLKVSDIMPKDVLSRLSSGEPVVTWSGDGLCERTRRTLARAHINAFAQSLCDAKLALPASRVGLLQVAAAEFAAAEWRRSTAQEAGGSAISSREADCLQWAAAGKTSQECAVILGLSPHTVNQHLASAAEKLGAVNRVQAIAKAVRAGLVNLSAI
jgi:DNA-binding CsgD family transcriptional regulator